MCDNSDIRLRAWTRPLGENGDLADVILATLSLASRDHQLTRVRLDAFDRAFAELQHQFPKLIPSLLVSSVGDEVYSERLGEALENALRLGIRVSNPQFQFLEVTPDRATLNIARLTQRVGEAFIEAVGPLSAAFATKLHQLQPGAVTA